jgi:hypothetical protein
MKREGFTKLYGMKREGFFALLPPFRPLILGKKIKILRKKAL